MITVNGIEIKIENQVQLQAILAQLNLSKQLCAVEVNNKLVPHKDRDTFTVQDGDTIEIVSLVGGG